MEIFLLSVIVILILLLVWSLRRNRRLSYEKKQLASTREAALDIANRVVNTQDPSELYQYILETCLKLIPKARFGSILMLNSDGDLVAKASVGFNQDEISQFKIKPEDTFLYRSAGKQPDHAAIINRVDDLVQKDNLVKSGKEFAIRSEVSAPLYTNGEMVGILCIDGDKNSIFTEQDMYVLDYMSRQVSVVINNQSLYSKILYLSRYDSLSRLLNRYSFEQDTTKLLNDPSRDTANLYFVLMDMDALKVANDLAGHQFGDQLIRDFSEIIRGNLAANDLCARYGGDEFVAVVHGDSLHVNKIMEKTRQEFLHLKDGFLHIDFTPDFSYGKTSFLEGGCDLDTLYRMSDKRMYESKNRKSR